MEEADVLGDRIVIMASGKVICYIINIYKATRIADALFRHSQYILLLIPIMPHVYVDFFQ